uniref:BTB domain-containing protein n=1 Tax=Steinernema glaseri TaxID=37863 RepID=A0A1I8ACD5_9BILA
MSHATITGTLEGLLPLSSGSIYSVTEEVEIGKAKWALGYENVKKVFYVRCVVPEGANYLWNITARGRLAVWDSDEQRKSVMWSGSFTCLDKLDGCAWSDPFVVASATGNKFQVEIEVIKTRIMDLSSPTNEAIDSPEDAACLDVDGQKVWVSKKVLSWHSPYFKTFFFGDFKEKATESYSLKDMKINEFKRFLAIIFNFDIPIRTDASFEDLLRLGDMYQCDTVLRFCRELIRNPKTEYVSLKTKILFCDRQGFSPLLADIIRDAPLNDLKEFIKTGYDGDLNPFVHCLIEERFVGSD